MLKGTNNTFVNHILPWLVPVIFIGIWQVLGQIGFISQNFLPTPLSVVEGAIRLGESGELFDYIFVSTGRALLGFLIGGIIGFVFGLINGTFFIFEKLFDTSIQMIRTIPHLALIPLVIIWYGIGEEAKIFLVALGVAFPIYLNTFHGIKNVDKGLLEMGKVYRLKPFQLFTNIMLPGALPSILVGVRYALGIMWMSLIVAETIGSDSGIGYMATSAREFVQMDIVILSIVLYALLGKLSDFLATLLEHRWLQWHPNFFKNKKQSKQKHKGEHRSVGSRN